MIKSDTLNITINNVYKVSEQDAFGILMMLCPLTKRYVSKTLTVPLVEPADITTEDCKPAFYDTVTVDHLGHVNPPYPAGPTYPQFAYIKIVGGLLAHFLKIGFNDGCVLANSFTSKGIVPANGGYSENVHHLLGRLNGLEYCVYVSNDSYTLTIHKPNTRGFDTCGYALQYNKESRAFETKELKKC